MTNGAFQTDYRTLLSATIMAKMAHARRAEAAGRADETAAARLAAAETARATQTAWATEQISAVATAAAEGQTRTPRDVADLAPPTPPTAGPAATATARDGLADARHRSDLALRELRDLAGALRLWQLQRSKLLRAAAIGLIVLLAIGGVSYAVRAAVNRSAEETAATQTAEADIAAVAAEETATAAEETVTAAAAIVAAEETATAAAETATAAAAIVAAEETATAAAETATAEAAAKDDVVEETEVVEETDGAEETDAEAPAPGAGPVAGAGRAHNRGGVPAEQVFVPGGTFRMGTNGGGNDERPIHDVTVDSFWIDRTEVTNAQFGAFVAQTGLVTTAEREGRGHVYELDSWEPLTGADWRHPQGTGSSAESEHPVVLVTWNEAAAFCAWAGSRLPTEAEWEYAARGPESLPFPWGISRDPALFNSCDVNCPYPWRDATVNDGYAHTAPVGSYLDGASWVGALDMLGNVWEWVADWFDENAYTEASRTNPTGPTSGALRVIRGAAWVHEPGIHYSANRGRGFPDSAYNGFGFRCAATPDSAVGSPASGAVAVAPPPVVAPPVAPPPAVSCQNSPGPRWGTTLWARYGDSLGCALNQETRGAAAYQYFTNGMTVWRQDRNLIYVLYNNNRYATYPDNSPPGYRESDLIKGGFGHLWNTNQTVHDGLGPPLAMEFNATDFAAQDFQSGTIFYFFENDAHNYVLFNDGTWLSRQQ